MGWIRVGEPKDIPNIVYVIAVIGFGVLSDRLRTYVRSFAIFDIHWLRSMGLVLSYVCPSMESAFARSSMIDMVFPLKAYSGFRKWSNAATNAIISTFSIWDSALTLFLVHLRQRTAEFIMIQEIMLSSIHDDLLFAM